MAYKNCIQVQNLDKGVDASGSAASLAAVCAISIIIMDEVS